jgi:hypothetical protein
MVENWGIKSEAQSYSRFLISLLTDEALTPAHKKICKLLFPRLRIIRNQFSSILKDIYLTLA